jgi:hypothetical protein
VDCYLVMCLCFIESNGHHSKQRTTLDCFSGIFHFVHSTQKQCQYKHWFDRKFQLTQPVKASIVVRPLPNLVHWNLAATRREYIPLKNPGWPLRLVAIYHHSEVELHICKNIYYVHNLLKAHTSMLHQISKEENICCACQRNYSLYKRRCGMHGITS